MTIKKDKKDKECILKKQNAIKKSMCKKKAKNLKLG